MAKKATVAYGEKKEFITPVVPAYYARLKEPRPPFEGDGPDYWQINLLFDPADAFIEEVHAWAKAEESALRAANPDLKSKAEFFSPFKERDYAEGMLVLELHRPASYVKLGEEKPMRPPAVWDAANELFDTDIMIGNGSKARAQFQLEPKLHKFGFSVASFLKMVQVVDLIEYVPPPPKSPFDALAEESPF